MDTVRLSEEARSLRSCGVQVPETQSVTNRNISSNNQGKGNDRSFDPSNVRSVLQEGPKGQTGFESSRIACVKLLHRPPQRSDTTSRRYREEPQNTRTQVASHNDHHSFDTLFKKECNNAASSDAGESEQGHQQLEINGSRPHTVQDHSSFAQNKQRVATKPESDSAKEAHTTASCPQPKSTISDGCPDWMHIPHVPVLLDAFGEEAKDRWQE